MLTCKQVTRIVSQAQERPLSFMERLKLRLHLMMCKGCRNYNKQMSFIRKTCCRLRGD